MAIEKMATVGHGQQKKITEELELSTTKQWLQRLRSEGEMVSHNSGRPRGEQARAWGASFNPGQRAVARLQAGF